MFEFDPEKSAANLVKHGIDFETAQALWTCYPLLVVETGWMSEPRWLAIGLIEDKHWTAVFTYRGENVRIISVRRSRNEEVMGYDTQTHNG